MSTGFDWQTEDEAGWDVVATDAAASPSRFRFLFPILFGLIFITLLAIPLLWRQLQAQVVAPVTERTTAEVLAVHELVLDAAAQQDEPLFWSMLDGAAATGGWRHAQMRLMAQGDWPGWESLGLTWRGAAGEAAARFTPDYTQATITQAHRFQWFNPATAQDEEIALTQTFTYQFTENEQWVLSANPRSEQQVWRTESTPLVAFIYPEQNGDLSLRLASGITDNINRFCAQPQILCESLPSFTVTLDDHLPSLAAGFGNRLSLEKVFVRLPAPIVIGVPQDDAGVQALQTLYTQRLIVFLMPYMNAGLVASGSDSLVQIEQALGVVGLRPQQAASSTPSIPPSGPPPIPWPDDNLWLTCSGNTTTFYAFSPSEGTWNTSLSSPGLRDVYPFGDKLILLESLGEYEQQISQLSLWQNGQTQLMLRLPAPLPYLSAHQTFFSQTPIPDQLLLSYNDEQPESPHYVLVDTEQCDATGCKQRVLTGQPIWSPDGSQALLVEPIVDPGPQPAKRIYLGDAAANPHTLLATGHKPVWLDNHTIAYFALPPVDYSHFGPIDKLVVLDVQTRTEKLRLTYEDFYTVLPHSPGAFYNPYAITPLPDNQLLITFAKNYVDPYLNNLFSLNYDFASGVLTAQTAHPPQKTIPTSRWHITNFQPPSPLSLFNGQPFTWRLSLEETASTAVLEVELPATYPLGSAQPEIITNPNESWIAVLHEEWLTLLWPDPLYQTRVPLPEVDCGRGFWFLPPTS